MVKIFILFSLGAMSLAGCAAYSTSGQSYPRYETRTAYDVEYGEVLETRVIEIEGYSSIIGTFGGAEVGRAIGGTVDSRDARRIAQAVGTVAGAVAGEAIERKITAEEGLEITVHLDQNDTVAIVQGADVQFTPGERVRVLFGPQGSARVSHL